MRILLHPLRIVVLCLTVLLMLITVAACAPAAAPETGAAPAEAEAGEASTGTTVTGGETGTATTEGTSEGSSGTTGSTTSTTFLTTNSTGETDDPTGGVGSGCEGFAAKYAECFPRENYDEMLAYCEEIKAQYSENYGAECEAAFDDFVDCYASSSCSELDEGEVCESAYYAMAELCAPEPGDGCLAFEEKYVECFEEGEGSLAKECQKEINGGLEEYGESCGQAYEDYYACFSALECAEYEDPDVCAKQEAAVEEAC